MSVANQRLAAEWFPRRVSIGTEGCILLIRKASNRVFEGGKLYPRVGNLRGTLSETKSYSRLFKIKIPGSVYAGMSNLWTGNL
jgi:hypothetical protein